MILNVPAASILSTSDAAKWQMAKEALVANRHAAALPMLRELAAAHPGHAEIHLDLGNASEDADYEAALAAYRRAVSLAPRLVPLLIMAGHRFEALRQHGEAGECFAKAVEAAPASVDALVTRAMWLERAGKLAEASECAVHVLKFAPRDDQARYAAAWMAWRSGEHSAAETLAQDVVKSGPRYPYVVYAVRYLLAQLADAAGDPDAAMRWLREAKEYVSSLTDVAALHRAFDKEARNRLNVAAGVDAALLRSWQKEAPAGGHALLAGHPRSGTTLIERVLGAHPGLTAIDESMAFPDTVLRPLQAQSVNRNTVTLDTLSKLKGTRLENIRTAYRHHLLREVPGDRAGLPLLDKNPSITALLPVWLRLFPNAPVIIALRDPRDVVLSCYFQNLPLNRDNANFLTLERTVEHYAALMNVWLRLRDLPGLCAVESRYETTVGDLSAEGARLTRHLGLEWQPPQAEYHSKPANWIAAPTYHDAAQPVHRRAAGRWRAYEKHLEPVLPKLESWLRTFGYES